VRPPSLRSSILRRDERLLRGGEPRVVGLVVLLPTVSMMTKAAMHRMRGTMMITSRREVNSAKCFQLDHAAALSGTVAGEGATPGLPM
jgi:hypothetical protein